MRTIQASFQAFEGVKSLSCSAIRKIAPVSFLSEPLKGTGGRKIYAESIRYVVSLRYALSSSERLGSTAIIKMMNIRITRMQEDTQRIREEVNRFFDEHGVDGDIYAYFIAEITLILRQILCLPSMFLRQQDLHYSIDEGVLQDYLSALQQFQRDITEDMLEIETQTKRMSPGCDIDQLEVWTDAKRVLSESKANVVRQLTTVGGMETCEATPERIREYIGTAHYTNVPYLFLDVLVAMGHIGEVTDGPGDGSRDIETKRENKKYFTQVKGRKNPPIGQEEVRQFAQTCRTYVANGYYVTIYRFARNAENGVWPQASRHANEDVDVSRQKIADVELVDMDRLVNFVYQYQIGMTAGGLIDQRYWALMKIAGKRREINIG